MSLLYKAEYSREPIPRWLGMFREILHKPTTKQLRFLEREQGRFDAVTASRINFDAQMPAKAQSGDDSGMDAVEPASAFSVSAAQPHIVSRISHKSVVCLADQTYDRIAKLAEWKTSTAAYAAFLSGGDPGLSGKVGRCGSWVEFHRYYQSEGSPEKLAAANFCREQHHCTCCAALRADRNVAAVLPKVLTRLLEKPELRAGMLTITCRDEDDLNRMITRLTTTFYKWWQRKLNYEKGLRKSFTALAHVDGAVMSCETKLGKNSGKWHFHAHIIVLVPDGLTKFDFFPEWSELLGYEASCHFKYFESCDLLRKPDCDIGELVATVGNDLHEPLKYAMKTNDMPHAAHYHAAQVLRRKRLLRTYGSLYDCEPMDELTDDLSEFDGQPFESFLFRWKGSSYEYKGSPFASENRC